MFLFLESLGRIKLEMKRCERIFIFVFVRVACGNESYRVNLLMEQIKNCSILNIGLDPFINNLTCYKSNDI